MMFRSNRGKAVITKLPQPSNKTLIMKNAKEKTKANEVLKPIFMLSLLVGYVPKHCRVRGIIGGFLWLTSLVLHSSFDFLSARKRYGYAWAFIQILLFMNLAICTYSIKTKIVPWLEFGLRQLEKENKYIKTFARIKKLYRIIPWVVVVFSICSTGLRFYCYHHDDAFSVSFEQQVSKSWSITLLVIWFVTSVHTLYAFSLFWCVAMCTMYATGYSMTEYHELMTAHLKNKDTPITFRQAVHSFAERGRFLKKSASACRMSLAFLLVYSIASLAVNAFYFLYKDKKATYAFFALVPPICSVYPLCLAAWVTKQYKWYLVVVVKAWAERPESTDDEDDSGSDRVTATKDKRKSLARKFTKRVKNGRSRKDESGSKTNRRMSLFSRQPRPDPVTIVSHSDTDHQEDRQTVANSLKKKNHLTVNGLSKFSSVSNNEVISEDEKKLHNQLTTAVPARRMSSDSRQSVSDDEPRSKQKTDPEKVNQKPKASRQRVMELILRGTARAVGRLQHRAKLPKFNFEKYISYLQNVLPSIGFDIMGITVTWNMVSTLLFLEVSLLALFVQESVFGNQKAKVSL